MILGESINSLMQNHLIESYPELNSYTPSKTKESLSRAIMILKRKHDQESRVWDLRIEIITRISRNLKSIEFLIQNKKTH